jgi:hypothetical protein
MRQHGTHAAHLRISIRIFALSLSACAALAATRAAASDHDDTPLLKTFPRPEARITDLYAFTRGPNLVLALCTNPAIPPDVTAYKFPSHESFTILIDNNSLVRFTNAEERARYGGTIVHPALVHEDVTFTVSFDALGQPDLDVSGLPPPAVKQVALFTGLRDDPFIRGPRIGRNVAAIVIEVPLRAVVRGQPTLLIWAVARTDVVLGRFQDLAGRALRSQFIENDLINTLPPNRHTLELGVPPDVMIFDTSLAASFPNGRALTDDVVDLVADPRVVLTDAPFPTANDVPFLDTFPYLAPPHVQ